ncbi:MAG: signal peptidase I, partial [Caldisericia bacterium]|nr:signal peptidase I [Caldisericia bacterium]
VSSDEIELAGSKLSVNGEVLKNSMGQEYRFSKGELNMLKLYIKDKHIPKDTFFLFGDNVSVSTDSRKFGAVSANDFLGKFEKK